MASAYPNPEANAIPLWGVYDDSGNSLVDADLVAAVEMQAESTISDYPIEGGSFRSYNKVDRPATLRVRIARSGKSADRTAFLAQIEDLRNSVDTVTIATPERAYANMNVVRYDYARSNDAGAQMIVAELFCEEVRSSATATYTDTASPSANDPVNNGTVQCLQDDSPLYDGVLS